MQHDSLYRRDFLKTAAIATAVTTSGITIAGADSKKPALLGGEAVRKEPFASWPIYDPAEEARWLETLRAKSWYRFGSGASNVVDFEKRYAEMIGVKHCLAIANGTSALITSLNVLDIGPGDEGIVPPYTFSATINAVLLQHALPVFVDTDINTFQIDATKIEAALTENTRCLLPVHLGGAAYDVDAVAAIAAKHRIPVVEDACQSHLGEWRGKRVGSFGATGCYSFQVSKNISCGDGGAFLTNDDALMHSAFAFHTNGRGYPGVKHEGAYARSGANLRLTEFQGAILLGQLDRVEAQSKTREENAAYLTSRIEKIPGITPVKPYAGCTRNAYHLYMFRYDPEAFGGLPRATFLKAMGAEGIPASPGYRRLNVEPFIRERVTSRTYMRVYGEQRIKQYLESLECPENDKVTEQAVWFTQGMLLGPREDMDQIANAIEKISAHAKDLLNV